MIRRATKDDLPTLCVMASEFYAVGNLDGTGLECDIGSICSKMESLIEDEESSLLLVDERDNEIIGSIAGQVTPWVFNAYQTILSELWWFVPKRHRIHKMAAFSLLKELKRWGKSMGAKHMVISSTERPEQDRVVKLYARIGLRLKDINFVGRL